VIDWAANGALVLVGLNVPGDGVTAGRIRPARKIRHRVIQSDLLTCWRQNYKLCATRFRYRPEVGADARPNWRADRNVY
jgi:hypothetical protein